MTLGSALFRPHDYAFLMRRWRVLCRKAGLRMREFAQADGYPLFEIVSPSFKKAELYLSAGIHGDEPASTEGLLAWAEAHLVELAGLPLRMYPCLNPWGLVHNQRADASGIDLNRCFGGDPQESSPQPPQIARLCERLSGERYRLALHLHEDYDGAGFYLYELRGREPAIAEKLLEVAVKCIPLEPRATIDGMRRSAPGVLRRRVRSWTQPRMPEALYLFFHHAERTFTFETPSEFDLRLRVKVQKRMIETAFRLLVPDLLSAARRK